MPGGGQDVMTNSRSGSPQVHDLAEQVVTAMRQHYSPGYPRSFEVWYAHLSGEVPALSMAMNAVIAASNGEVGAADIDTLYEKFISTDRLTRQAERTSLQVLAEIDSMMALVDRALSSSEQYHGRLCAMSEEVPPSADRQKLREWVEALVLSTREEVARKTQLEGQLRESAHEIHNLREALESTRAEALTDPLTGLANRPAFMARLEGAVAAARRDHTMIGVLYLDIDRFKVINDSLGHAVGDKVPRLFGAGIKAMGRESDIVGRLGGEEFAVVLDHVGRERACFIADQILTSDRL